METDSKLIKAMDNIDTKERYLIDANRAEKNAKWMFGSGLLGAAYLGVRVFVGPDILDNMINNLPGPLSIADMVMIMHTAGNGVIGGLNYMTKYKERREYERNFEKAKLEYRKLLEEEYPSERRTLKK